MLRNVLLAVLSTAAMGLFAGCGSGSHPNSAQGSTGTRHEPGATKAATAARNHRSDRPPISTDYPPSSPCGDTHFDSPPTNAMSIRVAGGSCTQAVTLVRRTHEHCARGICDIGTFRCDEHDIATGVLAVYCRNRKTKITWDSGGGF
jgi:hypothetical protein